MTIPPNTSTVGWVAALTLRTLHLMRMRHTLLDQRSSVRHERAVHVTLSVRSTLHIQYILL
jgi:hypothetical protein